MLLTQLVCKGCEPLDVALEQGLLHAAFQQAHRLPQHPLVVSAQNASSSFLDSCCQAKLAMGYEAQAMQDKIRGTRL